MNWSPWPVRRSYPSQGYLLIDFDAGRNLQKWKISMQKFQRANVSGRWERASLRCARARSPRFDKQLPFDPPGLLISTHSFTKATHKRNTCAPRRFLLNCVGRVDKWNPGTQANGEYRVGVRSLCFSGGNFDKIREAYSVRFNLSRILKGRCSRFRPRQNRRNTLEVSVSPREENWLHTAP